MLHAGFSKDKKVRKSNFDLVLLLEWCSLSGSISASMRFHQIIYPVGVVLVLMIFSPCIGRAQEDSVKQEDYPVKLFRPREEMMRVELTVKARQKLLELRAFLENRELQELNEHCGLSISSSAAKIASLDSARISLTSGLSWEINDGPPGRPGNLLFKLLSKKGRQRPEVVDWIKYEQFLSAYESKDTFPNELIDSISLYYTFNDNSQPCLQVGYAFKPSGDKGYKLVNKEVKIF